MVMSIKRTCSDIPTIDKNDLLTRVLDSEMQTHAMASLEYTLEIILDMQFLTMDTMIESGGLTLTEAQKETYSKLKTYAKSLNTFSLGKSKFDIDGKPVLDYIFFFKDIIAKHRAEYFEVRERMENM